MSNLDPRIEAVRKAYDLAHGDFWQIPQNKQWVCKHSALEIVAAKAGVKWEAPQIIEANAPGLVTSMVVTGTMGDRTEWATGETNPTNYSVKGKQPAYPWAMSEKRAKDRVILKLVGIHGLVYSEDEISEPVQPDASRTALSSDVANAKLQAEFQSKTTLDAIRDWWKSDAIKADLDALTDAQYTELKNEVAATVVKLKAEDNPFKEAEE